MTGTPTVREHLVRVIRDAKRERLSSEETADAILALQPLLEGGEETVEAMADRLTTEIEELFEEIDPSTHERISILVEDAMRAALSTLPAALGGDGSEQVRLLARANAATTTSMVVSVKQLRAALAAAPSQGKTP